jgi:hypothetical protein
MARKPTGNPRGRPKGNGTIGEDQVRFTVRIPGELYSRFVAFAEGRSFTRGDPQLAVCVRDALAHYLACPHTRQTHNIPPVSDQKKRQTGKRATRVLLDADDVDDLEDMPLVPETASAALGRQPARAPAPAVEDTRQPESISLAHEETFQQTRSVPELLLEPAEQSISPPARAQASPPPLAAQTPVDAEDTPGVVAPAFDPHKQMLGSPCKAAGHRSHGEAGNLREIVSAACVACATEKKAAKAKAKRQAQPA